MSINKRVLVTGGGTFLGDYIAAALLAEGAEVTLLVRPGAEDKLGPLAQRTRWWTADVWNPGSLKGRGRGHDVAIHTVGSMVADPAKGLSYNTLNFISARNVANMCVSGGVPHMVLMSSARAPWTNAQYISAKREAEAYITRVGLRATAIRAPLAYVRGARRNPFYQLMTLLASFPPPSLVFGRVGPMPVDVLARGVARIALEEKAGKSVYYAADLRKRNSKQELRRPILMRWDDPGNPGNSVHPFQTLDEGSPFGWTPEE